MNITSIPVISVAISVIICWALFAMLCSMLHEAIVQTKAERGRFMKTYLLQQLHDFPNDINWATLLYAHGSIDLLSRAIGKPTSSIPSNLFAKTLIEIVGQSQMVQRQKETVIDQVKYTQPLLQNFKIATLTLLPSDVVSFFKQAMADAELKATAGGITDEAKLYDALVQNIETWYNEFGSRMTLWYQKKTRVRLFFLGFIVALIINIDSVQLFSRFKTDPAARTVVQNYYRQNVDSLTKLSTTITDNTTKLQLSHTIDSLTKSINLPIGLEYNIFHHTPDKEDNNALWLRILGLLITGFAASFGAPFWFDVLKKAYSAKP